MGEKHCERKQRKKEKTEQYRGKELIEEERAQSET